MTSTYKKTFLAQFLFRSIKVPFTAGVAPRQGVLLPLGVGL